MLTATLALVGLVLAFMALAERAVRRLPLSPALIYLTVGAVAAALEPRLFFVDVQARAATVTLLTEVAVLWSLFTIGLRVRMPVPRAAWRSAIVLATSGMLATIVLGSVAAALLLGLDPVAALLLAAILAPTDPVLASEVQVHDENDADAVRLSLTVEGALNDATALPVAMLALGLLGLHQITLIGWLWHDLAWPMLGAAAIGWLLGHAIGVAARRLLARGHGLAWDELLFLGSLLCSYALARALDLSSFLTVFMTGAALLVADPGRESKPDKDLAQRLLAFGERGERLVEVSIVLFVGAALTRIDWNWSVVAFAVAFVCVVRPLSVVAVIGRSHMTPTRRRLLAWFGIRGVGSFFYLAFALDRGVDPPLAQSLVQACVITVAASILVHGVSATPVMRWYQQRRLVGRTRKG